MELYKAVMLLYGQKPLNCGSCDFLKPSSEGYVCGHYDLYVVENKRKKVFLGTKPLNCPLNKEK